MPAYSSPAPTAAMPTLGSQQSRSAPTAYPSAYPSAYPKTTLTGTLAPFQLPSAPSYPSMLGSTASFKPLPPLKPLETLARRGRPRWGLRFLLLLIVAGTGAWFLRPFVPWIDARVTPVETSVKSIDRQYGISSKVARLFGKPAAPAAPVAPAAPIAVERAAAPAPAAPAPRAAAPAGAKAAVPGARPDIQPLSPRASRGAGVQGGGRGLGAATGRPGAVKSAGAHRRSRSMAYARTRGVRQRGVAVRRRAAFAAARLREEPMPSDEEIGGGRIAPAAAAVAAGPAPEAEPAPAAPAAAPAAPAEKPAPVEKGPAPRTTASIVKEAASSGDELDRLMAGAVSEKAPAAPRRGGDRAIAEIERKIADVDRGGAPSGGKLKQASATAAPPLSTSDIKTVMAGVQKQMNACYRQHGKMGVADVKVEVAPDGSVPGTLIRGELAGTPTGACVESKIKAATFPASAGLRFDYRLSVR